MGSRTPKGGQNVELQGMNSGSMAAAEKWNFRDVMYTQQNEFGRACIIIMQMVNYDN